LKPALIFLLLLGLHLQAQTPEEPEGASQAPDAGADYAGPTLPSRRGAASVTREGSLFNIRPFVSLQGIYDTGLSSLSVDANGNAAEANDYGVEGTFGVLGYRTWKRTTLGIDYRGNARHYSTHSFYDGFDNSLTLSVDHDVNRHWRLMFGQALASYSRNYYMPYGSSWLGVPDYAPPSFSNLAGHELFDGRTNALLFGSHLISGRVTMSFLDRELIPALRDGAKQASDAGALPAELLPLYSDGKHVQHWPNHDNHIHVRVSETEYNAKIDWEEPFEAP
jgi:hypothetical protein